MSVIPAVAGTAARNLSQLAIATLWHWAFCWPYYSSDTFRFRGMPVRDWRGKRGARYFTVSILWLLIAWSTPPLFAQEVEIRRWNHLPINANFVTVNFAHTEGDIAVDPTLRLENVTVELDTWLLGYIHAFELLNKTARIELRQAWQSGTWEGLVNDTPRTVGRDGASDTFARFSLNLVGAPPLAGKAYATYRATTKVETNIGAALSVQLPTGEYFEETLVNLGTNRFTFSPQAGVYQRLHNWSFEATAIARFYTDNTSFFGGKRREQDPLYAVDGSIEYSFQSGLWVSAGAGINVGGQSTVDGIERDDRRGSYGWAVRGGFPIMRSLSFRAGYLDTDHWAKVGIASQTVSVGLLGRW